ncbi:MAG TPA: metal-dependent transcriptional regulator [Gemmatimonadales bacterium]|nr:metal-dependent transcriptional regulator [Gemmatimonadales bacterium]
MAKIVRPELTRSVEDYLKAIYQLSEGGQPASTNAVAEALSLAPPSVSGMLKRLAEQGLVVHEPYRGATLSRSGTREALRVVRRHRLIETYLVARLGYTWDTVHAEAERLEHAASDDLVERLAEALGNPAFDPHGDPIPGVDGSLTVRTTVPLTVVPDGTVARIARVDTDDGDRLRWLASEGLVPGTSVTVVSRQPFDGPIALRRGRTHQVIGHDLAALVLCVVGEPS